MYFSGEGNTHTEDSLQLNELQNVREQLLQCCNRLTALWIKNVDNVFLSSILHVLNYMIICRCFLCFYISGCDCSVFLVCLPWTKNLIVYAALLKIIFYSFFWDQWLPCLFMMLNYYSNFMFTLCMLTVSFQCIGFLAFCN